MTGRLIPKLWSHDPAIYAPARYRRGCAYDAFIPDALAAMPTDSVPLAVAGTVSDAERAIAELNATAQPALQPFARLLLRTESIASSKVEGMQVDARALARAEARHDLGANVGSEAREVIANIDAMQLAVEDASSAERVTIDHLVAIHRVLMASAPNAKVAGVVRIDQNWIGGNNYNPCGADFVPPPPEYVADLLRDLCGFCNGEEFPPIVQAAVAHAQFETIHPFADGNGRTGRALVQIILRRRGLAPSYVPPISVVLAAQRRQYIDGLTWFRGERASDWIEQFATAAARAAKLAARYLTNVRALQDEWCSQLRASVAPRSDAAAWRVIDALPGHPVITVPVASAATDRSKAQVGRAVLQLEEAGVLAPLQDSTRNRSWEAVGLLDILAALEAGTP
jgi:Fic family protein